MTYRDGPTPKQAAYEAALGEERKKRKKLAAGKRVPDPSLTDVLFCSHHNSPDTKRCSPRCGKPSCPWCIAHRTRLREEHLRAALEEIQRLAAEVDEDVRDEVLAICAEVLQPKKIPDLTKPELEDDDDDA